MKRFLKENKWQIGEKSVGLGGKEVICRACLDEITERILETVNDDSDLSKE